MRQPLLFIITLASLLSALTSASLLHPDKPPLARWALLSTPPRLSTPFAFSLTAHMPDPAYLATFLADRSDPTSPHWLQWHTYESLQPHITPVPSAVSAIEAWLASAAGVAWQAYGPFYRVTTTVSTAETLFNTTLAQYQHQPSRTTVVRQASATYLPDSVASVIDVVHGIDKHDVAVPSRRTATLVSSAPPSATSLHSFHPTLWNGALTGHDISLWYSYPDPLLQPAPPADSDSLWPTSIGVLQTHDDENYWLPGLAQYGSDVGYANANLSGVVTSIELLDVQAFNNPQSVNDSSVESQVDLEAVVAVTTQTRLYAMKCSAAYCESSLTAPTNLVLAMQYSDPLPQVISYSYGKSEFPSQINQEAAIQTLTALGVTLVAGVGDIGYESPEWPASSTYILSVGGTDMVIEGGVVVSESAWQGSAGGVSAYTLRPSYQSYFTTNITNTHRTCPDVAALAGDFHCYLGSNSSGGVGSCSGQCVCGGTSLSAPLWAGVIALLNNVTLTYCNTTLGFVNPLLYTMAVNCSGCFRDITTGSSNGYSATAGYDLLTGLGTPNVATMQAWLAERLSSSASKCPPQAAQLPSLVSSSSSSFFSSSTSPAFSSAPRGSSSSSASSSPAASPTSATSAAASSSSSLASSTAAHVQSSGASSSPPPSGVSSSPTSPTLSSAAGLSSGGSSVTSVRSAALSSGSSAVSVNGAAVLGGSWSVVFWSAMAAVAAIVTRQ